MTTAEPPTGVFTGHTVAITGGAGDIGLATAHHLGGLGARIVLLDIDEDALTAAAGALEDARVPAVIRVCDVTDASQVDDVVTDLAAELGTIRYLFNNAGYQGSFAPTHTYALDDFERVMHINVTGAFIVLAAFARHLVAAGGGAIVNTASMAGVRGSPNMIAYATSKAALIGMTRTASKDLAPHGIRVNAISPGYLGPGAMWTRQVEHQAGVDSQYFDADPDVVAGQMTGAIPLRRPGHLREIPGTVAFLLSDDASYITGVDIPIAGGLV